MESVTRTPQGRGITILTCTRRPDRMHQLLQNYGRQRYKHKELIIILNNSTMNIEEYRKAAEPYGQVRIYRMPEHVSLGQCLNVGVSLSRYPYIAKFDDDDYYAPGYLAESMQTMTRTRADIVGKRAHFMVLQGTKKLLHRYYNQANRFVSIVQGATLLVRRSVFRRVTFPDLAEGEGVRFCEDCVAAGFKIYSGSPYNFIAYRRLNSNNHTWKVSNRALLTRNVRLLRAADARRFVTRSRSRPGT